jgi:hypothetical protein
MPPLCKSCKRQVPSYKRNTLNRRDAERKEFEPPRLYGGYFLLQQQGRGLLLHCLLQNRRFPSNNRWYGGIGGGIDCQWVNF